ncbi:hypothetical protein JS569_26810, partial [Klebsiella pneumoniae]|uniref:hypothetical protein n=1 Tax=Klebsiella pneumoniae TaxID=573 RepID=UPI00194FA91D
DHVVVRVEVVGGRLVLGGDMRCEPDLVRRDVLACVAFGVVGGGFVFVFVCLFLCWGFFLVFVWAGFLGLGSFACFFYVLFVAVGACL